MDFLQSSVSALWSASDTSLFDTPQMVWISACVAAGTAYFAYNRIQQHQEDANTEDQRVIIHTNSTSEMGDDGDRVCTEDGSKKASCDFQTSRQLCKAIKSCRNGAEAVSYLKANLLAVDAAAITAAIEACGRAKDCSILPDVLAWFPKLGLRPSESMFTAGVCPVYKCCLCIGKH